MFGAGHRISKRRQYMPSVSHTTPKVIPNALQASTGPRQLMTMLGVSKLQLLFRLTLDPEGVCDPVPRLDAFCFCVLVLFLLFLLLCCCVGCLCALLVLFVFVFVFVFPQEANYAMDVLFVVVFLFVFLFVFVLCFLFLCW